jgi:hypothetical protein
MTSKERDSTFYEIINVYSLTILDFHLAHLVNYPCGVYRKKRRLEPRRQGGPAWINDQIKGLVILTIYHFPDPFSYYLFHVGACRNPRSAGLVTR